MTELIATKCCGMWEINNLSHSETPLDALIAIEKLMRDGFTDWARPTPQERWKPFVIFTGVVGKRVCDDHASSRLDNYGQAFADFVEVNGLGPVVASAPRKNHTTYNMIQVWIWHPAYPELFKFYDHLKEEANVQSIASLIEGRV